MGVVVEVVLETRRRVAVTSRSYCTPAKDWQTAIAKLTKARSKFDALFAIMVPDRGYLYMETRKKVRRHHGGLVGQPVTRRWTGWFGNSGGCGQAGGCLDWWDPCPFKVGGWELMWVQAHVHAAPRSHVGLHCWASMLTCICNIVVVPARAGPAVTSGLVTTAIMVDDFTCATSSKAGLCVR